MGLACSAFWAVCQKVPACNPLATSSCVCCSRRLRSTATPCCLSQVLPTLQGQMTEVKRLGKGCLPSSRLTAPCPGNKRQLEEQQSAGRHDDQQTSLLNTAVWCDCPDKKNSLGMCSDGFMFLT